MHLQFVTQPVRPSRSLRSWLGEAATDETVTEVEVAVAWVRSTGVREIADALTAVRAHHDDASIKIVVGLDHGNTSVQGLRAALALTKNVWLFHERTSPTTFHPKVYLATGTSAAYLLIGSHNLTGGGTFANHEAGLAVTLDLSHEADQQVHQDVRDYMHRLRTDPACSRLLTDELFERLLANPRFRLADENERRDPADGALVMNEDGTEPEHLFGAPDWPTDRTSTKRTPARSRTPAPTPAARVQQDPPPIKSGMPKDIQDLWNALHAILSGLGELTWSSKGKGPMYKYPTGKHNEGRRFAMPQEAQAHINLHLYHVNIDVPERAGLNVEKGGGTYDPFYLRSDTDLTKAEAFLRRIYTDARAADR